MQNGKTDPENRQADLIKEMPPMVRKYHEAGFFIPPEYWDEIESGIPLAELYDEFPVYNTAPGSRWDQILAGLRRRFGKGA